MRFSRLNQLESYILENESVSLEDISNRFSISMSTVRRDINKLLENDNIFKVYGGVSSKKEKSLVPYVQRSEKNYSEKEAIAKEAAKLIENNDVIFIDSGTTTYRVIKHIDPQINVTIITASVSAVIDAFNLLNIRLICLPGELERDTNSFCGVDTVAFLNNYNINKAFMAAVGVSSDGEVTNSSMLEYDIKRKAMEKSKKKFLLIDSEKYKKVSLLSYNNIKNFDIVFTGKNCSEKLLELCKKNEVNIQTVKI